MSGKIGDITPWPLYYQTGSERSLREVAEHYLQVILKSNPSLLNAQVQGWPPLHNIGVQTGMILAALGCQITEAADLLRYPEQWERRFREAEKRYPEVGPVVSFFKDEYIPMREAERRRLTNPFMDKIFPFPWITISKPCLAAIHQASTGRRSSGKDKPCSLIFDMSRIQKCDASSCFGSSQVYMSTSNYAV